jgi:putative addiction module killer protein
MDTSKVELLEYVSDDGKNIFRTWLRKLKDTTARARIRVRLNRVRLGNFGDCKPVGQGVSELRIDYGPGYRFYFGKSGTVVVLLLCGGTKKSQAKDIRKAQKYWTEYQHGGQHE